MLSIKHLLCIFALSSLTLFCVLDVSEEVEKKVTYDGRSLIINGKRELLFSGSIHYPRLHSDMWQDILEKAKAGGLNVIQTYVFWNIHEPVQGKYNFEGNNDLVKYIKTIGDLGMYVTLRVGPFVQAEWNYGGLPYWLREVPNITFRTDNEPFKYHMERYTKKIINMMKDEKLFAPQGGPIILSQIENEYNTIQPAFKELGTRYVQWAGTMAEGLKTGVPWIMCKQKDAPDKVINTCNGRNCGDTFTGPNKPNKPLLWTENWTAQYRVFGDPPSQRAAEDLAYSVARFFSKNGTLVNYYMYYGGTNFGRTASSFVMTRYYDEAPLDEFGLYREPKWGHLRDLHSALRLCRKALFWGALTVQELGGNIEARIYGKLDSDTCSAFLTNKNTKIPTTVTFRGAKYYLPSYSISILPDCKTVVYNTKMIVSQHNARNYQRSETANNNLKWKMYQEKVPVPTDAPLKSEAPLEIVTTTKDTTDYLWYTTSIVLDGSDLPFKTSIQPVIQVANLGHLMHAFVNGKYVGSAHGSKVEKSFVFVKPVELTIGTNNISLLGATVGQPDSGSYLEKRLAGVHAVTIQGLNTGNLDLSEIGWRHKVGLDGEDLQIFTLEGSKRVKWKSAPEGKGPTLTWYKARFDAPEGKNPVAIQLNSMGKGMVWVNGQSIGRYWSSFHSPLGKPSQPVYHIPRAFMKPTSNLLVVMEEEGGDVDGIQILTVNRDTICSFITETHLPKVQSWEKKGNVIKGALNSVQLKAYLQCPDDKRITQINFASYGNPIGSCGNYALGNCSSPQSESVAKQLCVGRASCSVPFDKEIFNKKGDLCPNLPKVLAIQAQCG